MKHLSIAICFCLFSTLVHARGDATGELALYVHAPRTTEQETRLGKELFLDIHTTEHTALFARAYHDEESWITTLGIETCFMNDALKIGISGGGTEHEGNLKPAISPSLYYHTEKTEAFMLAEYTWHGSEKPFYRGFVQRRVYGTLLLGLYGESDVGWGPTVGIEVTDHMTVWGNLPVAKRPDHEERIEFLFGVRISFD